MEDQKKNAPLHNFIAVLGIIISATVIVLAVLQIFDIWNNAITVFIPLMGLNQLCQAYTQWHINRKVAYFNIGTAGFLLICTVVIFFLK
ncbi:MAG: hypothetical protein IJ325_02525 [Clostridia bacterium]|nr:hypothetical protein [Clostridia bacterium]